MWDSTAVAAKNDFFCLMQLPIMIEHKKFSGNPTKPIDIFIWWNLRSPILTLPEKKHSTYSPRFVAYSLKPFFYS